MRNLARRYSLELRYVTIAALLVGVLVVLDHWNAFSGLDGVLQDAIHDSKNIGVGAVFLIALFSNVALIIQVPYTIPLLGAALAGSDADHMLVLGLASGLGAGLGEMVKYLTAEKVLARKPGLAQSPLYQWVTRTSTARPRLTALIVFVATATPLPDDVVIIPFAMVKHGARKVALPLIGGKIAHNVAVALIFYQFTAWAQANAAPQVRVDLVFGVIALFVLVILYQAEKARSATRRVATTVEVSETVLALEGDYSPSR